MLTAYILGPVILYLAKLTSNAAPDFSTSMLEIDLLVTDMYTYTRLTTDDALSLYNIGNTSVNNSEKS